MPRPLYVLRPLHKERILELNARACRAKLHVQRAIVALGKARCELDAILGAQLALDERV